MTDRPLSYIWVQAARWRQLPNLLLQIRPGPRCNVDTGSKRYFDTVASRWDEMRADYYSNRVREVACGMAGIEPGKLAADIGAGTGYVTMGLVKRGLSVVAVDQSEQMLAEMRSKFEGISEISYRIGRAEELPIASNEMDYVFANMYLHHVENPPIAITEMVRILTVGGKLVITDLKAHDSEILRIDHYDRWLGFDYRDIQRWFRDAGLEQIVVDDLNEMCGGSSANSDEFVELELFAAVGAKELDDLGKKTQ